MSKTARTIIVARRALAAVKAASPTGATGALFTALCAEQWQALTAADRRLFDGLRDFADTISLMAGARVIDVYLDGAAQVTQ